MTEPTDYFPEPSTPDDTWGGEEENPVEWLRRSSLPRAVSIRRALNENLRRFGEPQASSLAKKLRADWKSHWFELLVGRYLQEMDARVEHEPLGSNGTRIDFRGIFREGVVSVEAMSPRMNLHAVMGRAYIDNSEQRVRYAMREPGKRAQAEGATKPAILAIDGGVFGADIEAFDRALLGYSVMQQGFERETVGHSFDATKGEMTADPASPWAAVMAFPAPGIFGADEPLLYVSPHFDGHLPFAFLRLRRRGLAPRDWPATGDPLMPRIPFAEPLAEGPD